MHISLDADPALVAAIRSAATLLGETPEEIVRLAVREGLPAVEMRRTMNARDLRRRREHLEAELAATERMLERRADEKSGRT